MYKLLIYDLDGTLIDSKMDIVNAANFMLNELGFKTLPPAVIYDHVGEGVQHLMRSLLKISTGETQELLNERAVKLYRGFYRDHLLDETKLYPSVKSVLEHFKGKKQAVVTNKPEDFSKEILKRLKVDSYFLKIIGGDQKLAKKPAPDSILELMKLSGAKPNETVIVGDSDIDIQTGRNAGIFTIGVTYGFKDRKHVENARPDKVIDDLKELVDCVQ